MLFCDHNRTTRWLDRCLAAHQRPEEQSIFPIVQGGLDPVLRTESAKQLTQRDVNGFAIGGLRWNIFYYVQYVHSWGEN